MAIRALDLQPGARRADHGPGKGLHRVGGVPVTSRCTAGRWPRDARPACPGEVSRRRRPIMLEATKAATAARLLRMSNYTATFATSNGRRPRSGVGIGSSGRDQRRRRRQTSLYYRRPAAASAHGDRGEDLRRRGRGAQVAGGGGPALRRLTARVAHGDGSYALRYTGVRPSDLRVADDEWRSDRHPGRGRYREKLGPASDACRPPGDGDREACRSIRRRVLALSTDGRHAAIELYMSTASSSLLQERGITIERRLFGTTSPREMGGCRSRCSARRRGPRAVDPPPTHARAAVAEGRGRSISSPEGRAWIAR